MSTVLTQARRKALETLRDNRELIRRGMWWGNQSRQWLIGEGIMAQLKRRKLVQIDTVGGSSFAVITPKGERALVNHGQRAGGSQP